MNRPIPAPSTSETDLAAVPVLESGPARGPEPSPGPDPWRAAAWKLGAWVAAVTLACVVDWVTLVRDTMADALHSYAVMIPAVSVWFAWSARGDSKRPEFRGAALPAVGLGIAAAVCIVAARSGWFAAPGAGFSVGMLGWVLAVWAGLFGILGTAWVRSNAFAVGFLLFTVPLPPAAIHAIEIGLQHSTAAVVEAAFRATHVTYSRDSQAFWLPGLRFVVARECSGIRSTLVLFVTSLVGSQLLLRAWWRKGLMTLVVIALGIARNAFRICVITLLSVHVDPHIIDSPLHHSGGPFFFAISLIPFFVLLWWFRRQERVVEPTPAPPSG